MPRGKRIDVPDHQRAFAIEQLTACRHEPVLAARLRRVQHMESAGRIPPLVHRPDNGELPGPWLALKGEPLGRIVNRLHLAAPPKPEWPATDQARQKHLRLRPDLGGRPAGWRLDELGVDDPANVPTSAAWPSSAVWSPGSSTCRAVSFIMTMSLLRASTIPLV